MNINRRRSSRAMMLVAAMVILSVASSRLRADIQDTGTCNGASVTLPFTDVQGSIFFCAIAEAYFSGLTNGTTATTYGPGNNVTRDQMAAFITRTQDSALRRGSRRAALGQWATPSSIPANALTTVGNAPLLVQSDGADLWVANSSSTSVTRVSASDGKLLDTYTGMINPFGVLVARGRIYVTGETVPGRLYSIDPRLTSATPGAVTTVTTQLGDSPISITTDGTYIWTANNGGSVSKVNPDTATVQTFTYQGTGPIGIIYDGANIWVTDLINGKLLMLNSTGNLVLQTITVGSGPRHPVFDGTNIWVPNSSSDSVTVVRVKDAAGNPLPANAPFVVATLTGNGLNSPIAAAFDGQRILVTNSDGPSVSLWKAADFSPLGFYFTPAGYDPFGTCSDGINFWITLRQSFNPGSLARF